MASSSALRRAARYGADSAHDDQPLAGLRLVSDLGAAGETAPRPQPAPGSRVLAGSDEHLAARVAVDGQAPFAALYERHRDGLERYCLSMVRHREDAADAAHEAWLRAFTALSSPRMRPISFRAWLFSIARNACTDRLRERGRFSLNELDESDLGEAGSLAEQHETRETVRVLLRDLEVLSERQRSAIALREVAGLSLDEIAVALETTPPKVMTLLAEARRVLHERQAGRRLPCDSVRRRIDTLRVKSHRMRAHLDDCPLCRAHHARARGHRLSSLALVPVALLRPLVDRVARLLRHKVVLGSVGSKLAATGAIAAVAGGGIAVHASGGHRSSHHPAAARHAVTSIPSVTALPSPLPSSSRARATVASPAHAGPASAPRHAPTPAPGPVSAQPTTSASGGGGSAPAHRALLPAVRVAVEGVTRQTSQLTEFGRNATAAVRQSVKSVTGGVVNAANGATSALKPVLDAARHL